MPDDPNIRGGHDRDRINVNQKHELDGWAEKFGVSPEQLQAAVKAVGVRADKVEEYLKAQGGKE